MAIEVRIATDEELHRWNEFVEESPQGTIFHTIEWLRLAEKHTRSKLYPLVGLNGNKIIGLFPCFYQKKMLLKMVFSPPPKTAIPYLGPIMVGGGQLKQNKKEAIFKEFIEGFNLFIKKELVSDYIHVQTLPEFMDLRPFKWSGYRLEPLYTYVLDLRQGESKIWENFDDSVRRSIKKAERVGVKVKEGSEDELKALCDLLTSRYNQQARSFPVSKEQILELYHTFYPKHLRVFVTTYEDKLVGGIVFVTYKDYVSLWIGATKSDTPGVYPNDLVLWRIVQWAISEGFKYCEIIGAGNPSISYFKSKYGPDLKVYFENTKANFLANSAERAYRKFLKSRGYSI